MADSNFNKTCRTCIYFSDEKNIMGSCRRFPTYQNRHHTEWCGEYLQNAPKIAFDNLVQDVTREQIMTQVSTHKPKSGRPRKYAA